MEGLKQLHEKVLKVFDYDYVTNQRLVKNCVTLSIYMQLFQKKFLLKKTRILINLNLKLLINLIVSLNVNLKK